ncbi:MAG: DUF4136 domain-containing protein [Balneola sp.]
MKAIKLMGLLMSSLLFVKCVPSLSVISDYDRDAEFSDYTTFYWSDEFQQENDNTNGNEPLFYNTLMKKRLKQAIEREMEGRGYTLSSTNPDLLVNPQVVVEERSNGQSYSPYYYGYYRFGPSYNSNTQNAKEGDIVIDLVDREKKQLVWQGYAPGVLETNTKDREENIKNAVTLIFSEYGRRAGQDNTAQINK